MDPDDVDTLIEEATVDAYGEFEQRAGFYTMLEDNLSFPFPALVIGISVTVQGLDMKDNERIVARVKRNGHAYTVDILDLEIEYEIVRGSEWIAAYREWASHV